MEMLKEYWDYFVIFVFGSGGGLIWKLHDISAKKKLDSVKHEFDIKKELTEEVDRLQKRLDKADADYEELLEKYYSCLNKHTELKENKNGL